MNDSEARLMLEAITAELHSFMPPRWRDSDVDAAVTALMAKHSWGIDYAIYDRRDAIEREDAFLRARLKEFRRRVRRRRPADVLPLKPRPSPDNAR
jgi:hypothetical protein